MERIRSIVAASDLSQSADSVVRAAGALAELTGAQLHVVHAFDMELAPYTPHDEGLPGLDDWVRDTERRLDEQIARALPASAAPVTTRKVIVDKAHRAIEERADAVAADLIVVGRHRERPMGNGFLGTTADRVIRTAHVPCLVVGGDLGMPLRRLLVPLDMSDPALRALDTALRWAGSLQGSSKAETPELTVMHVIPRVYDVKELAFDTAVIGPELEQMVEAARARVGTPEAITVREIVRWGDRPAEEIVAVAAEESTDLIVLATHGYGAFKRFLIGSIASGVTRHATCPVLLIPWSD
ncbi:MAG TPA: universal stress protein [Longimicrobiales bacterium]|nr:universal stress protein [Longimicrobiales bacterium]